LLQGRINGDKLFGAKDHHKTSVKGLQQAFIDFLTTEERIDQASLVMETIEKNLDVRE